MHRIDTAERRARIAARHHVAPAHRVSDVAETARGVVCLHATDPTTVYLSAWARLAAPSFERIERALYEDRSLLRMMAMRRTLFVVPVDDAPILQAAAALALARRERERNGQFAALLADDEAEAWLTEAEATALSVLRARGQVTVPELTRDAPELDRKVRVNVGKSYEGEMGLISRVLNVLAIEGRIVRTRPRGTWVSSQYRWSTMEDWLGAELPELDVAEAQAGLIGKWLARFGPGTEADLRWWTGLTAREIRAALAAVGAAEVSLEEGVGYVLPGDLEPTPEPGPWVALLPSLDPTTMGWQTRDWYLGEHRAALFDRNGNAGATIWASGRVVGGWAARKGGEVVARLLEDIGREAEQAVQAEAARLSGGLGSVSISPRFPSPLHRELIG